MGRRPEFRAGSPAAGPLSVAAEQAGSVRGDSRRLQKALTSQVEQAARDALHRELAQLPPADQRRQAWFAADSLASQWVTALPHHGLDYSVLEFREVFTTYLGLESPVVRPFAHLGWTLPSGSDYRLCDVYGLELSRAVLPGGADTLCHDTCLRELTAILRESGLVVRYEPRDLFRHLLTPAVLARQRLGIVPDAAVEVSLPDVGDTRRHAQGGQQWSPGLLHRRASREPPRGVYL